MTVFVVEDHPDIREVLRLYLSMKGFDVVAAGDCAQAMQAAEHCKPAIFLLDLRLPDGDGRQLLHSLRGKLGESVPALALTAHASPAEVEACLKHGFDECLIKPVSFENLDAVMARLMSADHHRTPEVAS